MFKRFLHFIICFQLVFQPTFTLAQGGSNSSNGPTSKSRKNSKSKDKVKKTRKQSKSQQKSQGKSQRKGPAKSQKSKTAQKKSLDLASKSQSQKKEIVPQAVKLSREHFRVAKNFNHEVASLYQHIFGPRDASKFYQDHPLDFYGLTHQTQDHGEEYRLRPIKIAKNSFNKIINRNKEQEEKVKIKNPPLAGGQIKLETLFIEIFKQNSKDPSDKELVAIVNNDQNPAVRSFLPSDKEPFYTGNNYTSESSSLYTFEIATYNRSQIRHIFPQNIRWIAMMDGYLIFMEPSESYKKKRALISFIDLNYFHPALGKTALPIFKFPVDINSPEKEKLIFRPEQISISNQTLSLIDRFGVEYTIPINYMDIVSKSQQMAFNVMVSLLDVGKFETRFLPFIKDLASEFKKLSEKDSKEFSDKEESMHLLSQQISSQIEALAQLNMKNHKNNNANAHFQSIKNESTLNEENKKIFEDFSQGLKVESALRSTLPTINNLLEHKKISNRLRGLWIQLTMPQPLGAPTIQGALGLISNSLRKGEDMKHRFSMLKEGFKRLGQNRRIRNTSIAVLTGASMMASPETASYMGQTLAHGYEWLIHWVEAAASTGITMSEGVVPTTLWDAYIADGRGYKFVVGVGSLLGITAASFGLVHLIYNGSLFYKYLKSDQAKKHHDGILKQLIHFTNDIKESVHQSVSNAEFAKLGLPIEISFEDGIVSSIIFSTNGKPTQIKNNFNDFHLDISMEIESSDGMYAHLLSPRRGVKPPPGEKAEIQVISPDGSSRKRTFILIEGNLGDFFDKDGRVIENTELVEGISVKITGRDGKKSIHFEYDGNILDQNFNEEESKLVNDAIASIDRDKKLKKKNWILKLLSKAKKNQKELFSDTSQEISDKEIKNTGQAALSLFSFPHWTHTFSFLAKVWNKWFLFRTFIGLPKITALSYMTFNPRYFNRVHNNTHIATPLNGGFSVMDYTHPLAQLLNKGIYNISLKNFGGNPSMILDKIKAFEDMIIPTERMYHQAASEVTYLYMMEGYKKNPNPKLGEALSQGVQRQQGKGSTFIDQEHYDRKNVDINTSSLPLKDRIYYETFKKLLFEVGIIYDIAEQLGIDPEGLSFRDLKKLINQKIKDGEEINIRDRSYDQIRARFQKIVQSEEIQNQIKKFNNSFWNHLGKKIKTMGELRANKFLDPSKHVQIERYHVAQNLLSTNTDAVIAASRYSLAKFVVDKPIEIALLFIFLAGVDYGILQPLQDNMFSETSWFYLSRVALWSVFFSHLVLSIFGETWMKLQMDSLKRMIDPESLEKIPIKKDINKSLPHIRLFWKNLAKNKNNTYKKKFNLAFWKMAVPNIFPAIILYSIIYGLTLGRFDIDLFAAMWILQVLFLYPVQLKFEDAFEGFVKYAYKDIMKYIDLTKPENKKFLAHPEIVKFYIKKSNSLRRNYNVFYALAINNTIETATNILGVYNIGEGAREFIRHWLPGDGHLTDLWNRGAEELRSASETSQAIIDKCRKIFTNNRVD